ncbi:hypothetical protein ONO39_27165, partial [Salmonella enterica subsp. enterica serovar Anatum]|nr:hypothetical protein [Salmonella enterica subsp. enterica serovar Anatum]
RQIADDYLTQLGQGEQQVARWLEAENDPRLTEIVTHLNHVVEGNQTGSLRVDSGILSPVKKCQYE